MLGTSSSEAALPRMLAKMERFGCDKTVVGLVIPAGYSFNLDGTSIYLAMATIFLAQVNRIELGIAEQLSILLVLMVTSKGAAGVTGSGFIVLASTLSAMKVIPVESIALLLGVDRFMSEARAITNLIGNGVATLVISRSEEMPSTRIAVARRSPPSAADAPPRFARLPGACPWTASPTRHAPSCSTSSCRQDHAVTRPAHRRRCLVAPA